MSLRYVLSRPEEQSRTMASGTFGKRMEIFYFLAFAYLRLLPNFGIYAGSGTAGLSMLALAGVIMYKEVRRMSIPFFTSLFFPTVIVGFIWFIVLGTHPEFWQSSSFFLISRLMWPAEVIIISYLSRRPGFIKRLLTLMLFSAFVVLSFARYSSDDTQRLTLATGGFLANSNDFASWCGFCAICFGMWAFNARSFGSRIVLIIAAATCIGLIALTVSRASMSLALGILGIFIILQTIVFRPRVSTVLTVIAGAAIVVLLILSVGIDSFISSYNNRANEDSGRERLWSLAMPVVLENPLGTGKLVVYDPARRHMIGPHNVFLYLGLLAGWVPVILLGFYYLTTAMRMEKRRLYDNFLWIPGLFIYCLLQHNQSNGYIFELWSIITLSLGIMPLIPETQTETQALKPKPVFYDTHATPGMLYRPGVFNPSDSG